MRRYVKNYKKPNIFKILSQHSVKYSLNKINAKYHNHGRQIHTSHRRNKPAQTGHRWIDDPVQRAAKFIHPLIARVQDAENHQPAHHHAGDDHPEINTERLNQQQNNYVHAKSPFPVIPSECEGSCSLQPKNIPPRASRSIGMTRGF